MLKLKVAALSALLAGIIVFPAISQSWDDAKAYPTPNPAHSLDVDACNFNTGFGDVQGYVFNTAGQIVGDFYIPYPGTGCVPVQFRYSIPNGVYYFYFLVGIPRRTVDIDTWVLIR